MSCHTLYLVVSKNPRYYSSTRIERVCKKKPVLPRPTEQAIVRMDIDLPDGLFKPPQVNVQINPEHIIRQPVTVTPQSQ